jgi:asparagine synthase (glutamine-hydrolysing)
MAAILATLARRGPDAEGLFRDESITLGHRRLSIIDLSADGNQPMRYRDSVIVFNGEIYNYVELREELRGLGHQFSTTSDTEVILHAFEEWGEQCLERFLGMWAFALYLTKDRRLFLARDRFGIKPLYYFQSKERFVFCSEIKGILAAGITPRVNRKIMMASLVTGWEDFSEETFFEGIYQLLPGQLCWYDFGTHRLTFTQYYALDKRIGHEASPEEFIDLLKNSVEIHLRSDVPVGTCLSGGLDSSVIASLASDLYGQASKERFKSVTAQSTAQSSDETEYARQVVDFKNLEWYVTRPSYEDFAAGYEECLRAQDEPLGGPRVFMQYSVMKTARQAGVKVMLDGQGGDEILLGYERYYPAVFWSLASRLQWFNLLREYRLAVNNSRLTHRLLAMYAVYFLLKPVRKGVARRRAGFLKPEYVLPAMTLLDEYDESYFDLRKLQAAEISRFQLPHLLHYEDRNSMVHSIEARVPYLDHRCVEAAVSLPIEDKIRGGYTKYTLRRFCAEILPSTIAWRKNKMAFGAPEEDWLARHLPKMQARVAESAILREVCKIIPDISRVTPSMAWRLFNIAVWEDLFGVKN